MGERFEIGIALLGNLGRERREDVSRICVESERGDGFREQRVIETLAGNGPRAEVFRTGPNQAEGVARELRHFGGSAREKIVRA